MIRFMRCLKRKQGTTVEEFRRQIQGERYRSLIKQGAQIGGAIDHKISICLQLEVMEKIHEANKSTFEYDAVFELYWGTGAHVGDALNTPEMKALLQELQAHMEEFVDLPGSPSFILESES
jgi:EthD domain-containing protein